MGPLSACPESWASTDRNKIIFWDLCEEGQKVTHSFLPSFIHSLIPASLLQAWQMARGSPLRQRDTHTKEEATDAMCMGSHRVRAWRPWPPGSRGRIRMSCFRTRPGPPAEVPAIPRWTQMVRVGRHR